MLVPSKTKENKYIPGTKNGRYPALIIFDNQVGTVKDWAVELAYSHAGLLKRINSMSLEKAMQKKTMPVRQIDEVNQFLTRAWV